MGDDVSLWGVDVGAAVIVGMVLFRLYFTSLFLSDVVGSAVNIFTCPKASLG